jgi:hypothetical protein
MTLTLHRSLAASLCLFASCMASKAVSDISYTINPISGDSDVLVPVAGGTVLDAYYFGGSGTTVVNGVTFTGISPANGTVGTLTFSNMGGYAGSVGEGGGPFAALSANYQTLLGTTTYVGTGSSPLVVTVNDLTVGQVYNVQIFEEYARGLYGEHENVTSGGVTSGNVQENLTYYSAPDGDTTNASNGTGEYLTATFTATSTTQEFDINTYYSNDTQNYAQLTAIDVEAVPEPSTAALLSAALGLGAFVGLRRFRAVAA